MSSTPSRSSWRSSAPCSAPWKGLALNHRLRIGPLRMRPYLLDVLRDELGITVENTEDATRCH